MSAGAFPRADSGSSRCPEPGSRDCGGDELLFADGRSRNQPYLCLITAPAMSIGFRLTGHLVAADAGRTARRGGILDPHDRRAASASADRKSAGRSLAAAGRNPALVRPQRAGPLPRPRGLEQYSGGGWGTRDVCQGPVELLLALGRFEPVRDLLLRLFRQQNPDGDWPQWFMFFERERNIRPGDSHGDIVYLAAAGAGPVSRGLRRRARCSMRPCRSSIPRATPRPNRRPFGSMSSARWP